MFRLIVVDDEERILEGITELFPWNNIGFDVVGKFLSARLALKYLEMNPADVVMTDVSMPDMDGIAFSKELRRFSDCSIVFFSSYQDYTYMRAAIQQDITDYLLKPVKYDDLVSCFERIRERLEEKHAVHAIEQKPYYDEIIKRVDSYIEIGYRTASLSGAAELVCLSTNYLSKIYKDKSGAGFLEKLNKVRMEKACELLRNPDYKNYEIAYYVGYDNPKNFTRAFKSYYNISPREYRNGQGGSHK